MDIRGRVVSDALLAQHRDIASYRVLKDNLSYLEVPAAQVDDGEKDESARYILCHNPSRARADEALRMSALEEASQALDDLRTRLETPHRGRKTSGQTVMLQVSEILTKKGVQAYFDVSFDRVKIIYTKNEAVLAQEALRDGKFVVKTNTTLPADEVVTSYKTLMNVEREFREIKNFLDVGPMYHWNETRVRGHIFVCVLAYLFEQELQVIYRHSWQERTTSAEHGRRGRSYETPQRIRPTLVHGRTDCRRLESLACDEGRVSRQGVLERSAATGGTRRGSERLKHLDPRQDHSFTQRSRHYASVKNAT